MNIARLCVRPGYETISGSLYDRIAEWRNTNPNWGKKLATPLLMVPVGILGAIETIARAIFATVYLAYLKCAKPEEIKKHGSVISFYDSHCGQAAAATVLSLACSFKNFSNEKIIVIINTKQP